MVVPCYLNVHITAILTSLMADTFHFTFYLFLFNSFVRSFLSFSLRVNEPWWCDGARVMVVHVWFRFPLVSIWVFNQHARNDIPIIILINQNGWRLCCLSKWLWLVAYWKPYHSQLWRAIRFSRCNSLVVYILCVYFWVFPVFLSCKRSISYRCIELEALRSGAADKQTHQLEQISEQISKSHKVVVKCLMLLFISQPALMSLDFCQCHNIHR